MRRASMRTPPRRSRRCIRFARDSAGIRKRSRAASSTRAPVREPELIIDVAHNPQAARVLATWLQTHAAWGRTLAVFGALADKDVRGIVEPLHGVVDAWHLASLAEESPRGLSSEALGDLVRSASMAVDVDGTHEDIESALAAAFASAKRGDRVIAFGSFFIAAAALRFADAQGFVAR